MPNTNTARKDNKDQKNIPQLKVVDGMLESNVIDAENEDLLEECGEETRDKIVNELVKKPIKKIYLTSSANTSPSSLGSHSTSG